MSRLFTPRSTLLGVLGLLLPACRTGPEKPEPCTVQNFYPDVDGDGQGWTSGAFAACEAPAGYVAEGGDCNDQDPGIYSGAVEVCDGVDQDCDETIDEDAVAGPEGLPVYYPDADGDGFGGAPGVEACLPSDGQVAAPGDCDDTDADFFPGAPEVPRDGLDQDCADGDALSIAEAPYEGTLSFSSAEEIVDFCASFDAVTGDLVLLPGVPAEVEIPCLKEVQGDLVIAAPALEGVSLPILWWVGGELRLSDNPDLLAWEAASLRFVDGDLRLGANPLLPRPVFPALVAVGGEVDAQGGEFSVLTEVEGDISPGPSYPSLVRVGGALRLAGGDEPLELGIPNLERLESGLIAETGVPVEAISLPALNYLGVELSLLDLPNLAELDLGALQTVAGDVRITEVPRMSLDLPGLSSVEGDLVLALEQAPGLAGGLGVAGDVALSCADCVDWSLTGLSRVGGGLSVEMPMGESLIAPDLGEVGGTFSLLDSPELVSLELPALTELGAMRVGDLENLSLVALPMLVALHGPLEFDNLGVLVDLDLQSLTLADPAASLMARKLLLLETLSLPALGAAQGSIFVEGDPLLTDLDLGALSTIKDLRIAGRTGPLDLSSLEIATGTLTLRPEAISDLSLPLLRTVGGGLEIEGDVDLLRLDLPLLESVGGGMAVQVQEVEDLAFPTLDRVGARLRILPGFSTELDLGALTEVGGEFTLGQAATLAELNLPLLETAGTFTVDGNEALIGLDAPLFAECPGDVTLGDNLLLGDVEGLGTLTRVGGNLTLVGNVALTSVAGMSSLAEIGGDLRIEGNTSLPESDALSLAEDQVGLANIGGTVIIGGNAP